MAASLPRCQAIISYGSDVLCDFSAKSVELEGFVKTDLAHVISDIKELKQLLEGFLVKIVENEKIARKEQQNSNNKNTIKRSRSNDNGAEIEESDDNDDDTTQINDKEKMKCIEQPLKKKIKNSTFRL